jgi:glycosyltransferase involved in cell wall biosynthesis
MSTVDVPTHAPAFELEAAKQVELSIVVPMYDEAENVQELYAALTDSLGRLGSSYELIVVDDGSRDGTYGELLRLARDDRRVKLLRLRRYFGQTAAMAAGFEHSRGRVIIPMDGDLQNDPADSPRLLDKVDEGYDVVSGWRVNRKEGLLRRLPSRVANWLIGRVTGVRLHDYGCTLKAYRSEILKETRLYGEQHRFLPALAQQMGARITEIPVEHHARRHGRSKYGIGRTYKVALDLLTLKFLSDYSTKPIYVFGGSGVVLCLGGIAAGAYTLYEKYANGVYAYRNPAILLAVFLFLLGVILIFMGLLAELIIRTHHGPQSKPIYWIRESLNLDDADSA